ncbi:MAG: hypothetical protein R3D78_05945 [Paracoccaceae bacterium]
MLTSHNIIVAINDAEAPIFQVADWQASSATFRRASRTGQRALSPNLTQETADDRTDH